MKTEKENLKIIETVTKAFFIVFSFKYPSILSAKSGLPVYWQPLSFIYNHAKL